MRFTVLFTYLTVAVVALAMPHVARQDDSLSQATDIARTLGDELASLLAKTRKSLYLQKWSCICDAMLMITLDFSLTLQAASGCSISKPTNGTFPPG
jgi:hypothetical protein